MGNIFFYATSFRLVIISPWDRYKPQETCLWTWPWTSPLSSAQYFKTCTLHSPRRLRCVLGSALQSHAGVSPGGVRVPALTHLRLLWSRSVAKDAFLMLAVYVR